MYYLLEYNIIFLTMKNNGRKPCCMREHIIGVAMVSERDFYNLTFSTCRMYGVKKCMHCKGFLEM